jgi:hypothetical protein
MVISINLDLILDLNIDLIFNYSMLSGGATVFHLPSRLGNHCSGGLRACGGESEVLSKAKMSDHPHTFLARNPRNAQKLLAKQQFSRLESRASQRFSDPAAEGMHVDSR